MCCDEVSDAQVLGGWWHLPQTKYVPTRGSLHIAVTQERKPVLVPIPEIVVLHPRIFDRLQEVDGGAGPEVYPILDLAVFEPASARFLPDSLCRSVSECTGETFKALVKTYRFVKLVKMPIYVIQRFLFHFYRLDSFLLNLPHHLDRVLNGSLDGR